MFIFSHNAYCDFEFRCRYAPLFQSFERLRPICSYLDIDKDVKTLKYKTTISIKGDLLVNKLQTR